MLKIDFHLHAGKDAHHEINYSVRELIDEMVFKEYDVISITGHDTIVSTMQDINYAKKKGLLLISGWERTIEGKHVLLINITKQQMNKIVSWETLRKYKTKEMLVIVAHPFYPFEGAGKFIEENKDIIDALEYCHFYLSWFNIFNNKAERLAKKLNIPLIGTSDAHSFNQIGYTYALIDSSKTTKEVINFIKNGELKLCTRPLSLITLFRIFFRVILA